MGRNYFCDFCNRSFADILSIRKKHLLSMQHKRLRKMYYDSFKDASTLLAEESEKTPCKRFFQTGHCDFGENCRFSHASRAKLEEEARLQVKRPTAIDTEKVHDWVSKWQKKHEEKTGRSQVIEYRIPAGFPPYHQLPPSLQRPVEGFSKAVANDWG